MKHRDDEKTIALWYFYIDKIQINHIECKRSRIALPQVTKVVKLKVI